MACTPGENGLLCADHLPQSPANQGNIDNLLNIAFVVLGALAVLYIILAGFRFVRAGGDTNQVASARRQIIYGALGLIVIALASAIVNFVLGGLK
jgi:hypothetical protein